MKQLSPLIGQSINRLEGELKVTGQARYSAEYFVPEMLYGYVVNSSITKGTIKHIDTSAAEASPGVTKIFTHLNRPKLAWFDLQYSDMDAPPGTPFKPLDNNKILYNGQPIALIVAESFESARHASRLLQIEYEETDFYTCIFDQLEKARDPKKGMATLLKPPPGKPQGDFESAYKSAAYRVSEKYAHGTEHHNPMELFATTTIYDGPGRLTIYDKTQGTVNCQLYVANVFGLKFKNVRVISPYVGGAFGSGLRPQHQLFFSVLAALELQRPVRVVLERHQMFTFGHRPPTYQHIQLAADQTGTVTALHHAAVGETSRYEDYTEEVVNFGHKLYPAKNTLLEYQVLPVDVASPMDMRAPGGSTGIQAIETAMDALAYEAGIDPLQFRLINYAERDQSEDKPFSSKELRQCYLQGAAKFGWDQRKPEPRSMRRGNKLIGYGMATGIWEANHLPARAEAILTGNGKLQISSAVTDIGTGTLTVMTQIAADELGLALEDVTFRYADSKMPFAPIQGGSFTTSTIGSAIKTATKALRKKIFKKAQQIKGAPFAKVKLNDVFFNGGSMLLKADPQQSIPLHEIIAANDGKVIKTTNLSVPNVLKLRKYSRAAHSAVFVEVEVDEELGMIKVTRAVTAVAAGTIINPKTARSQILGGMVWGISKALMEETMTDHHLGKYMNQNLAEYHIPVHADIHDLDVIFVEEKDAIINELGTKGVGEIGIVGMPPAIVNAIYHATGKRIHQLPVHFDLLL